MLLASLLILLAPPTPHITAATTSPAVDIDQIRSKQWHAAHLGLREAHRITKGEGITVAVLDTGVQPHPDLKQNLLPGADLSDEGGDGRQDRDGHGTGMAGLIAAHGQSQARGALGIAPKARILPVRFKKDSRGGTADGLREAIDFAIRNGAQVVNISSAGAPDVQMQQATQRAAQANVVIVAAVGNMPSDRHVGFPAAYQYVVAVGGIDRSGTHAEVSVIGPEVDVVAPAVEIYSTSIGGRYRVGTGTSGATAIVAGAAALVRAKYPYLPADEVVHRLTATAIDKGPPGRDDQYGYGVVDLVAALTADVPPRGFGSAPASTPDGAGSTTAAADRPRADGERTATVRGLVTLGVLLAAGGAWALFARHRRRSDDPPPRISR
ncbi:type VII secretion-associated serine protease mycosin [Micromonospora radicis]|nr:type VII secretion-associated serine protease mycosin [Micromonospora radicis]